jgi:cysteinyl-tRNA synthetase
LRELAAVLGLRPEAAARSCDGGDAASGGLSDAEIADRIADRTAAKATRDFASADRIRDELKALGIELIDKPGGLTEWLRS